MKELRIALLGQGLVSWGGGLELLRICANALLIKARTESIQVFFLLPEPPITARLKRFAYPYKEVISDLLHFRRPHFFHPTAITSSQVLDVVESINGSLQLVPYQDSRAGLVNAVQSIHADVVLPCVFSLGRDFPVPWAGYIPDLQHKYLPEFFSASEIVTRDSSFAGMLLDAQALVVNGAAVSDDIKHWYPGHDCRIFTLPFAPTLRENWLASDSMEVRRKYGLPDRFFVIPNQLFVHKSHRTAFTALSSVIQVPDASDVHIICTGKTEDNRFPRYFDELKSTIRELGLSSRVRFLGFIPKQDQIQIVRQSVAVVQPTLFEGGPGGGAVYDAIAVGARAIVSDIPINREIEEGEGILFFKAGSAEDLAEKMLNLLREPRSSCPASVLIAKSAGRANRLGDRLLEVIAYTRNRHVQPHTAPRSARCSTQELGGTTSCEHNS